MKIKHIIRFLAISCVFSVIVSCSENDVKTGFIDPNEKLLIGLSEVKGYDHTYNYDFNILKYRENVSYYAPTSISEGLMRIPTEMREKLNMISDSDLPFYSATEESNIVTSWNDQNKLVFQIQFAYLENADGYDTNFQDYFIVSITQHPENPFTNEEERKTLEENIPLSYEILKLTDDLPLYYQPKSDSWPRMFDYYFYNDSEKRIYKESTGSFQYYAWHDGLIYKIGCNMDTNAVNPETLVRQIILGK